MKTVLLAVSSEPMANALQDALSQQYTVIVCLDGLEAVSMLHCVKPDLMLVDLMLTDIDGIHVLQAAWDMGLRIPTVAISTYFSGYITNAMEQLQVSSLIRLPCNPSHIVATIHSLEMFSTQQKKEDCRIWELLDMLGLGLNSGGYCAAGTAISLLLEDPGLKLTTELYPMVAKQCCGTATQVEKAIRDCIETAWKNRNEQIWRIYFKVGRNGTVAKPTNGEFLLRLTRHILLENEERPCREKETAAI